MSRSRPDGVEDAIITIQQIEGEFKLALEQDAEAEHLFKVEKAKAFLAAEGTEKARESQAIVATDKYLLDNLKKKAVKEFLREKLKDAQDALSARQSLLKYEAQTNFGYTSQT